MNLKVPIYFSAGLTIQANMYYKTFIGWTSQKINDSSAVKNAFDFKHVCPFKPSMINDPGPCVLFATPGMLTGGFSVEVFKHWAPSEKNLVTLPGYCLAGTLGHKLMSGKANTVDLDKDTRIEVRCQIHQLSFSPHTDAKGIMDLVGFLSPKHVILVHGEKPKMAQLKSKIESDLGIQTWFPANGETVIVPTSQFLKIHASKAFLKSQTNSSFQTLVDFPTKGETLVEGILMMDKTKKAKAVHKSEFLESLSLREKKIQFGFCCPMNKKNLENTKNTWLEVMFLKLKERVDFCHVAKESDHLRAGSLRVSPCLKEICCHRVAVPVDLEENVVYFCCSWSMEDEKLAWRVISIIRDLPNHVIDE